MNKTLQKKVNKLDPWFDALKDAEGIDIHAVEHHPIFGTVVFWSDERGYTYSYKSYNGQGTGGACESLVKCVRCIFK